MCHVDNDPNPIKILFISNPFLWIRKYEPIHREGITIESAFSQFDSWQGTNGATPPPCAKKWFLSSKDSGGDKLVENIANFSLSGSSYDKSSSLK